MLEARLDEGALVGSGDHLLDHTPELFDGRVRRLVLGDPGAHPDHLGERPVGDRVAVGEAAALVPPDVFDEAVEVLLEFPGEPRFADAGDTHDREQVGPAFVGCRVEEVLDHA